MRVAILFLAACAGGRPAAVRPDLAKLADRGAWQVVNAESRVEREDHGADHGADHRANHSADGANHSADGANHSADHGAVLTLTPVGGNRKGSNVGLALVADAALTEGTIDVDLRGRGETDASFLGVAFAVANPNLYEAVYFRPFRFRATDAVEHAHAVQYIAWPEHTWEALRARAPGVYEAPLAPSPDPAGWFHARIELDRTTVKVFVDGAAQPALVVERLRHADGGVGLWVDSQPGSFANLEIHRTR